MEGVGSAIAPVINTGSGELGEVDTSGVEGTGSAIILLLLSDSDDTDLDVVAKALLVASAPGTVGNDPYVNADRGGTDTPLDGELGLGAGNTEISRFRRLIESQITLNDNDSPAALDIGAYFQAGGAGNDLTIYLQTLNDGEVSFAVADQVSTTGGGGFARFDLPADAQTLFNNISTGDRWIFKAARPFAVTVQTGTGEIGEVTSAGIESTGQALPAATRSGSGEVGEVTPTGDEGTGRAIPIPITGVGEAGTVTTSGIEGSGTSEIPPPVTEQIFNLGSFLPQANWSGSILIDPAFVVGGAAAYLREVERVGSNPRIRISSTPTEDASDAGPELIPGWEVYEEAILMQRDGADDLILKGPAHPDNPFSDETEPYFWIADNQAEYLVFWDEDSDFTNFRLTFNLPSIVIQSGSGEAGQVTASATEGTGSVIAAPALLLLSDSDDTGLEVEAKALLVASATGTAAFSSDGAFYSDADRGGTDTPLDGELGLGSDNTLISQFQHRADDGSQLWIQDNDNPVALNIGSYFGASTFGIAIPPDGADLTIYLQTSADGEVSFTVADALTATGGLNTARFTLA